MTPERTKRALVTVVALAVVVAAACRESPTQPGLPVLEAVVAGGDGQFGTVGTILPDPLRVVVRAASTKTPQEDVTVRWEVTAGSASVAGVATTVTDSTGSAEVDVQLGSTPGEVTVRASVVEQEGVTVDFQAFVVDTPELDPLPAGTVDAGDTITLTGSNFSPTADQDVVLFSGVRGRVLTASTTSLDVVVPTCLPTRTVDVTVQLGTVASSARPLSVNGGSSVESLAVGEMVDVADDGGFECLRLPGAAGVQYLAVVYSASTIGAAQHEFEFVGLGSAAIPLTPPSRTAPRALVAEGAAQWVSTQARFEDRIRALEQAVAVSAAPLGPARVSGPQAVPSVGETRSFSVYNSEGDFDQVTAVAELVSAHAALFVDQAAPAGGFTTADLQAFADRFDDVIHPEVTTSFGPESDIDGNGRVIILFTPTVNSLTPKGSSGGIVGGFFFGIDLQPGTEGGNEGEVFYTLVPDPLGEFSDPRSAEDVLTVAPAVLAHEFQHMVHFNARVLQLGAPNVEALWLSEGLAQLAEEIVAATYEVGGDAVSAELFRVGNRIRAQSFLADPPSTSLIVRTGQGSLEERGAGFLSVLHMTENGPADLPASLTRTTRTGVENVEFETSREWPDVLADWLSAVYLDGTGIGGMLEYPDTDLNTFLGGSSPLTPEALGGGDFTRPGTLWSSSGMHYIVEPLDGGSVSLRLGAEAGGAFQPGSAMRLRVIRIS